MLNLFKDILQGFYSSRFYYDLAHERRGFGLPYIVILTALCTVFLPFYIWQSYPAIRPVIVQMPALANTLPDIIFQNGSVSINPPTAFRTNLGDAAHPLWVMLDTQYQIQDTKSLATVLRQNNVVLLLTSNHLMVMRDNRGTLEMEDLTDYPSFSISHREWQVIGDMIASHGLSLYIILFAVMIFVSLLFYNLVVTCITAIAVLVLSWILRASIRITGAIRLAAMARIPALVLTVLPTFFNSPLTTTKAWMLWLAYLVFAVFACREREYSKT